jgi:hypothetical protein
MPNEFVIKNGFRSQGNSEVTGSLSVSGSISTISPVNLTGFATGSVLFTSGSAGAITGSSNLFWNNTNGRLGIGLNNPSASLQVAGTGTPYGPDTNGSNPFVGLRVGKPGFGVHLDIGTQPNFSPVFAWVQSRNPLNYSQNHLLALQPNGGNVVIGTTTDAGFKLDVNGTARVLGGLTIDPLGFNNFISFGGGGNNTIFRDVSESSLNFRTTFSNSINFRFRTNSDLPNANTTGTNVFVSLPIGFAPTSGTGTWTQLSLSHTINQTGGANGITRGLYLNPTLTSAFDFRAIETVTGNNLLNSTSGNTSIGLSTNTGISRLQVRGSGATSATTAFRVENTNASSSLTVLDNGNVGIGTSTPGTQLEVRGSDTSFIKANVGVFDVGYNTSNRVSLTQNIVGFNSTMGPNGVGGIRIGNISTYAYLSANGTSLLLNGGGGNVGIGTISPSSSLHVAGTTRISGSFNTAISGAILTVQGSGSAQPILDIQGSQGQLFSVIDALSGSLMSVNDVSGLPILEVFSDDRVVMGTYGAPALIVTGSVTNVTGSLVVQGQVMDPAFVWFMS